MFNVMFTGGIIPRLRLHDRYSSLEQAISSAKHVMPAIAGQYYWCGIFDEKDELIWEVNFGLELAVR